MTTFAASRAFQILPAASRRTTAIIGESYSNIRILSSSRVISTRSSEPTLSSLITRFMSSQTSSPISLTDEQKMDIEMKIKDKGDAIRRMKEEGITKDELAPYIVELMSLKSLLDPSSVSAKKSGVGAEVQKQPQPQQTLKKELQEVEDVVGESDYITPRAENYSKWYNDLIRVCGLAETSPVRGCMVIKPWGMSIWDRIRTDLDARIQEHGAENAYFPLLIPKSFLSKEAEHVDGFAKECAVVTHHRLTVGPDGKGLIADPDAELDDPLIIRPTSETMIWSMFKKWIVSHRDLPLKVNQWANVMRWEMRTRPFLRTSEFLWQEGHTAHATAEGAIADSKDMLYQYADMCEKLLAIPVIKGAKSLGKFDILMKSFSLTSIERRVDMIQKDNFTINLYCILLQTFVYKCLA